MSNVFGYGWGGLLSACPWQNKIVCVCVCVWGGVCVCMCHTILGLQICTPCNFSPLIHTHKHTFTHTHALTHAHTHTHTHTDTYTHTHTLKKKKKSCYFVVLVSGFHHKNSYFDDKRGDKMGKFYYSLSFYPIALCFLQ